MKVVALGPAALPALLVLVVLLRLVLAAITWRGRRLMLSRWRRITRWEFWPPWIFYVPLLFYIAYLMVQFRSVTLFTAANPGILAGGFVRESKHDILRSLLGAGQFVARSRLIAGDLPADAKQALLAQFMEDEALALPIVLKPDHGQRGSGVIIVRSLAALDNCLRRLTTDTIVQEYVDGAEFGVFYWRHPAEARGRVFSVTEKRFPTVTGDGQRTLEQLILADDRAVCAARLYCRRYAPHLSSVPPLGQRIPLAELGTHCRGAMFLDGAWVLTDALEQRFDEISRTVQGFYFGRFDVRVPAVDAFRAGEGFKIIELNGVTSEATHIYDPASSLRSAYRVLMAQWRTAFEIGDENRRRGIPPTPLRDLLRLLWEYQAIAKTHLPENAAGAS